MELELKDKVALITGASRGIGAASAKALAYGRYCKGDGYGAGANWDNRQCGWPRSDPNGCDIWTAQRNA